MRISHTITRAAGAGVIGLTLLTATAQAQGRVVLPEGTVIMVRTNEPLVSSSCTVGETFETTVVDTVRVENYTVIPAGSRIRGIIAFAQPATRQRSGVLEVKFDRLTLPDGRAYSLDGKLTSTDAAERRRIEADPNARVVLVGGRGGVGAAIAAAGSENSPSTSILSTIGALLSEGRDVNVAQGTGLAVQLDQGLFLPRRGVARAPDAFTIYTSTNRITAAQRVLAQQNYYRGPINGQLDDATQRALFEFQVDKGIIATGNLDGRTAAALGLTADAETAMPVFSADEAAVVRRGAQSVAGRVRQELGIAASGRLDARRDYTDADIELWFSLSGFADNASLYEQMVRVSGNVDGAGVAGKALISAAKRVDAAMSRARVSTQVQSAWQTIRTQLGELDSTYR